MTLHLSVPDYVKEAEKPCELRVVGGHRELVDYTCDLCNFHPTGHTYDRHDPECKIGRTNVY